MKKRVAVLGLDALSSDYLKKLSNAGAIPYISNIAYSKGKLIALDCVPPVTSASWPSIMSGVNPGKHGIFSFFHYYSSDGQWIQKVTTANDLMHPRVHEMISIAGFRSIVFNPIPDYPIIPIPRTTVVSNLFFVDRQISYPKRAGHEFFKEWEKIIAAPLEHSCKIINKFIDVASLYLEAVEKAIKVAPDLLWINLNIPDAILHKCTSLVSKKVLKSELKLYSVVDNIAKKMSESFDIFMIVSDHGFSRYNHLVSVNDILVMEGYARPGKKAPPFQTIFHGAKLVEDKEVRIPKWVITTIKRIRLKRAAKTVLNLMNKISRKKLRVYSNEWVDIKKSDAFFPYHLYFGILLNNKNTKNKIIYILNKKYSKLLITRPSHEIYSGPYLDRGPDIVVLPRTDNGYWINPPYLIGTTQLDDIVYHHHPEGVLLLSGDLDTHRSAFPGRLPNYAVAQLVMHYLGVPLPKTRDRIPELEKSVFKYDKEYDYLARWKLVLRTLRTFGDRVGIRSEL